MKKFFRASLAITAEVISVLMQVYLLLLSITVFFGGDEEYGLSLIYWSFVAFIYLGSTALFLSILLRVTGKDPEQITNIVKHPITHFISITLTFGVSFFGLLVAAGLLLSIGTEEVSTLNQGGALASMFLSWAVFNWGYARIYFARFYRNLDNPPLEFPGTSEPRLSDFAYLAFTNATTFATPDVVILSSRMRWTVVWHTTLAFFFNALILGLIINVVLNGRLFLALL